MPAISPGEAFGGWFGRIAARYGLGVDELAEAAGIDLDLGDRAGAWIAAQPPSGTSLVRLCELSGTTARDIEAMRVASIDPEPAYGYCFQCLILNPLDVAAPLWQRCWLQVGGWGCSEHPGELDAVNQAELRNHRNMTRLLELVGHRHRLRAHRNRARAGRLGAASVVRGYR